MRAIVQGMQAKQAQDIVILNLKHIGNTVADYFIVCSGTVKPQVEAITTSIIETTYRKTGERPGHQEGMIAKEWVLIDYFSVIGHIFHSTTRSFYALETLWGDALVTNITD
mmetsp:Transcript_17042/g.39381  ORF Transcript_17042/g.39381 Transcript_17042/m.39381 type:complete len:111 (-) Transcript_17042:492-824(-)